MITSYFKNHFLIATPSLQDPNFSKSVIFLNEHTADGAMGIIINKPLKVTLNNVLQHLDIKVADSSIANQPVLFGGPVGPEQGFVLHNNPVKKPEADQVIISASKETLRLIAQGKGPKNYLVALGYAGWDAGQIEKELSRNDWLIAQYDAEILFETPLGQRWQYAAQKLLGIDITHLSDKVGHA